MRDRVLFLWLVLPGIHLACGGSNAGGGGTGGAGGSLSACGTNNDPSSGESCHDVVATGPCVTPVAGSGTAPTPVGGAVRAGTYDLSSVTLYGTDGGAPDDQTRRETAVITGSGNSLTLQIVYASGQSLSRQGGSLSFAGATATFTSTCPPAGDGGDSSESFWYSATVTTFTIYETSGNGAAKVSVFARR